METSKISGTTQQNKLIITENPYNETQILSFIQEEQRIVQILAEDLPDFGVTDLASNTVHVSQIYLGRVQSIVKNIHAAFVEVQKGVLCFLSLDELDFALKQGDELLVQITREAMGIKQPVCTTKISLSGEYCVCRKEKRTGIFFSKKLTTARKQEMSSYITEMSDELCESQTLSLKEYAFVIRTKTEALTDLSPLFEEMLQLSKEMDSLIQKSRTRTCFSLLKDRIPNYVGYVKEYCQKSDSPLLDIITDRQTVIDLISENLTEREQERVHLSLYTDSFSLTNLYSLKTVLSNALLSKIWLKSGAFLVIEPTEALVSIDVNTGKYIGNKSKEDTILKVNLEAAKEIAFQLRLRNLSGIIIVDFINMESKEHNNLLLKSFQDYVSKDGTQTNIIDMTKLGLIEVTRKKIGKPIYENLFSKTGRK